MVMKTHFEQISVETVKKIATELPPTNGAGNQSGSDETYTEFASAPKGWREVAQQVQLEQDPTKMVDLVRQLIAEFDKEELRKHHRPVRTQDI